MGVRFYRRGRTRAFFLPDVADQSAPTEDEFGDAVELTVGLSNITGFAAHQDFIDTPDLSSDFTPTVPGERKVDASSLKFYLDSEDNPLRTTLAPGTTGFVAFIDHKPSGSIAADDVVDVYPVEVGGTPKDRDMGNTAAQWDAEMAISAPPSEDVAVVA